MQWMANAIFTKLVENSIRNVNSIRAVVDCTISSVWRGCRILFFTWHSESTKFLHIFLIYFSISFEINGSEREKHEKIVHKSFRSMPVLTHNGCGNKTRIDPLCSKRRLYAKAIAQNDDKNGSRNAQCTVKSVNSVDSTLNFLARR